METPKQPESNGLAVASLVLGILSLTGASVLAGIPAIITGGMALKNPVSKGMSIAGIVMGVISVVLALLVLLFFIIVFGLAASAPFESTPIPDYESTESPSDSSLYQQRA
jgi:uncharacterized membrane protein